MIQKELGKSISQSYLSQIESGARPHLTDSSRMLLARFFKVHPGYLVDDPEGYQNELISDVGAQRRQAGFVAGERGGAVRPGCGAEPGAAGDCAARGFADVRDPAGDDSGESGAGGAAARSAGEAAGRGRKRDGRVAERGGQEPRPGVKGGGHELGGFLSGVFHRGVWLSVLAFLAGSAHLHLPHLHYPSRDTRAGAAARRCGRADLSWFNFGTIAAFLAWFGGTGYLLERYYGVWFVLALVVALASGIGGGGGGVLVSGQVADGAGSAARSGGLRDDRGAGELEHRNSRRRNGGAGLFAGRNAPGDGSAERGRAGDCRRGRK